MAQVPKPGPLARRAWLRQNLGSPGVQLGEVLGPTSVNDGVSADGAPSPAREPARPGNNGHSQVRGARGDVAGSEGGAAIIESQLPGAPAGTKAVLMEHVHGPAKAVPRRPEAAPIRKQRSAGRPRAQVHPT